MEATILKSKKNLISKGKIKKHIKNVICRPDPVLWPQITEEEGNRLEVALRKYKIDIPDFKKPHWKELKLIPKEQRPKQPKLTKIEGFLFGISECNHAIQNGQCAAVIIEAAVNPRIIVQPTIEACYNKDVPIICLIDLRKICSTNFGIPTSCLGLQPNSLLDLREIVVEMAQCYPNPPRRPNKVEEMDVCEDIPDVKTNTECERKSICPYLYRTNKKSRVFIPTAQEVVRKVAKKFIGQDFIEFSNKQDIKDSKGYMKMMLKRISNNADRIKKK